MQIHELPSYSGEPSSDDVFPLDTGTHTFKLPFADLGEAIITTVSATISGVSQTVKAAIEALAGRLGTLETKTTIYHSSGTFQAQGTSDSSCTIALASGFTAYNTLIAGIEFKNSAGTVINVAPISGSAGVTQCRWTANRNGIYLYCTGDSYVGAQAVVYYMSADKANIYD